jgi:uncharacterized membrane protein
MHRRQVALASAVAALFALGAGTAVAEDKAEAGKIKCEGVNECKGKSQCKTAKNACAGKNGCAGEGFLMLTPEQCEAAKAAAENEDEGGEEDEE